MAVGLLMGGCRASDLPATVYVEGTVTFADGPCPGPGMIRFLPLSVAPGAPRRPGRASFEADGYFRVTSFRPGDGLVPGTYRVLLECWEVEPAQGRPGVSYLTDDFQHPDLVVEGDHGPITLDIDVPAQRS